MAVQYDSKNNTWGGFIIDAYKAKKGIIEVSEEATKLFDKYKDKDLSNAMNQIMSHGTFDNFIEKNKLADETLIAFLQDTAYGEKTLANYRLYLQETANNTTAFQRITTAAETAVKGLVATLGSMAVMWAIGEVISLIVEPTYEFYISTKTLNDLCRILDCDICDIVRYIPSDADQPL